MKFTIPTTDLKDAIARLSVIPGEAGSIIYTQAVRFSAESGKLKLMRFTSEAKISITAESAVFSDSSGEFCADHTSLSKIVNSFKTKDLSVSIDGKHIHFSSGSSKARLALFSEEVESEPPENEMETESIKLPIDDLAGYFNAVQSAMSADAASPHLCGVCIRRLNDRLAFMATDNRRCHVALADHGLDVDCIVSAAGVKSILSAVSKEVGACTLSIGENTLSVVGGSVEITVSLLAEKFPNIMPVLNRPDSDVAAIIKVSKESLMDILDACSPFGETEAKMALWEVTKKGILSMKADNQKDSEISREIECSASANAVLKVASRQLITALDIMGSDVDGKVEILYCTNAIFIRQPDRIAFIALSKV